MKERLKLKKFRYATEKYGTAGAANSSSAFTTVKKEPASIVFICPNYNDSVSADIMAVINRLTALFRTNDFSKKRMYAIVVSGYSGGDLVAKQIMGAINLNKNFMLPGDFALLATANTPGSINEIPDIEEKAAAFAKRILLEY